LGLAETLLLVPAGGVREVGGALAVHADVILKGEVLDLDVGQAPVYIRKREGGREGGREG